MKLNIQRNRWVILKDRKKIFCGLARDYQFKNIDDIGGTAIKTYQSESKARASFIRSWWTAEELIEANRIEFVEVIESISTRKLANLKE